MTSRILLVRHGPTATTRAHAFPDDEELDATGMLAAARLAGRIEADHAVTSPRRRCRVTAELAGFPDATVDERVAEMDFGSWTGLGYTDLFERDPDAMQAWLADPSSAPHGGETLTELTERVLAGLRDLPDDATSVVFCHGGPIAVTVFHALGAPLERFWTLRVDPASITELHRLDEDHWTVVRVNVPPLSWNSRILAP